jgi:phage FluMu gp28-like protein
LLLWEKGRQTGATRTDAFDSVMKASPAGAKFDVWVTSRDELLAALYLEDCKEWAKILHIAATDIGMVVLDPKNKFSAHVLRFANGRRIYCLSSNLRFLCDLLLVQNSRPVAIYLEFNRGN